MILFFQNLLRGGEHSPRHRPPGEQQEHGPAQVPAPTDPAAHGALRPDPAATQRLDPVRPRKCHGSTTGAERGPAQPPGHPATADQRGP